MVRSHESSTQRRATSRLVKSGKRTVETRAIQSFSLSKTGESIALSRAEMMNGGRAQAADCAEVDGSTSTRMTRAGIESQLSGPMPR